MARNEKRLLDKLLFYVERAAQIVDYFEHEEEGKVYIVLKNAGDKDLNKLVTEYTPGLIPYKQVKNLTKQLLEAVDAIHVKYVCHRDLKPDNIIIKDDDDEAFLTLIDFGIGVDFEDGKPIRGQNGV